MNICLIGAGRIGIVHAIAIASEKNAMISMKKGGIVFVFNIDEEINDPFGIGAAINIVADEN